MLCRRAQGSLSTMRSSADAVRGLLAPAKMETGRARAPRAAESAALCPMCAAPPTITGQADDPLRKGVLHAASLCAPTAGALHLTPSAVRCVGDYGQLRWELPFERALLVQQRGSRVRVLAMAPRDSDGSMGAATEHFEVALHSEEDAARLHEMLRLASLNARGGALPFAPRWPLVRTTLLSEPPCDGEARSWLTLDCVRSAGTC